MNQIVLKFLEGRKENRVWYNGSYYALEVSYFKMMSSKIGYDKRRLFSADATFFTATKITTLTFCSSFFFVDTG